MECGFYVFWLCVGICVLVWNRVGIGKVVGYCKVSGLWFSFDR